MTTQERMDAKAFHLDMKSVGTSSPTGACLSLKDRADGKRDMHLTSPLSLEITINNNNIGPGDKIVFSSGSGSSKKVIAVLDEKGNLAIAGKITTEASL